MVRPSKDKQDQFNSEETQRRFEAALRGARIAGHKQMKDITKTRKVAKNQNAIAAEIR
jgi:hypothetical protein